MKTSEEREKGLSNQTREVKVAWHRSLRMGGNLPRMQKERHSRQGVIIPMPQSCEGEDVVSIEQHGVQCG